MVKGSPRFDGSSVKTELFLLSRCAREDGVCFCFVVAFSVSVVECDISYRRVAVRETVIWIIFRHRESDFMQIYLKYYFILNYLFHYCTII